MKEEERPCGSKGGKRRERRVKGERESWEVMKGLREKNVRSGTGEEWMKRGRRLVEGKWKNRKKKKRGGEGSGGGGGKERIKRVECSRGSKEERRRRGRGCLWMKGAHTRGRL